MKIKFFSLILLTLVLTRCGDRFGDNVYPYEVTFKDGKINVPERRKLPPLIKPSLEESEAIKIFEATAFSLKGLEGSEEIEKAWTDSSNLLKKDQGVRAIQHKVSLGNLIKLVETDKTKTRLPIIQLWYLAYGSKVSGEEYDRLEKILVEEVLSSDDFGTTLILSLQLRSIGESDQKALDSIFLPKHE